MSLKAAIKLPCDIIADVFEEAGFSKEEANKNAQIAEARLLKSLEILSSNDITYVLHVNSARLTWGWIKSNKKD